MCNSRVYQPGSDLKILYSSDSFTKWNEKGTFKKHLTTEKEFEKHFFGFWVLTELLVGSPFASTEVNLMLKVFVSGMLEWKELSFQKLTWPIHSGLLCTSQPVWFAKCGKLKKIWGSKNQKEKILKGSIDKIDEDKSKDKDKEEEELKHASTKRLLWLRRYNWQGGIFRMQQRFSWSKNWYPSRLSRASCSHSHSHSQSCSRSSNSHSHSNSSEWARS